MLVYLYGSDSYRRRQKLNSIIAEYQKKHSALSHEHFYLDEEDAWERLKVFAGNQSLFDKTKLGAVHPVTPRKSRTSDRGGMARQNQVIEEVPSFRTGSNGVHNLEELENEGKEIKEFLKSYLEDKNTTLVIIADKKLKGFEFLLKPPAISQEFEPLKGAELMNFVKKEAETRGIKISLSHLSLLISAFAGDTWGIITELEKMSLGGKPEAQTKAPEFFPAIQTIKSRRLPIGARLSALAYLLENEEPAAVFNVTASIADPELKIKMADYDIMVKSGKLEYEEALTDLVLTN